MLEWANAAGFDGTFELYHHKDVAAPIASGSFPVDGMVVVPCSGGTLGRIAHGISNGLLERAADVCLKERRRLVLVPREMPLSLIHLRNMTAVTEAGAIVLPASPGFYHAPKSIDDLIDMVAGRILASLGIDSSVMKPWLGPEPPSYSEEGIQ
jgi:4-hydroxy-3-polyprenylbenzoate decarboxylase